MAKRSRARSSPTDWVKLLDEDAIDTAWEEAVADACDDEERLAGFANAVENELQFPFPAKVMGIDVMVVGSEQPKVGRGLDLIVMRPLDAHSARKFAGTTRAVRSVIRRFGWFVRATAGEMAFWPMRRRFVRPQTQRAYDELCSNNGITLTRHPNFAAIRQVIVHMRSDGETLPRLRLVLCQPLKLGLNCICTTDFQSVGGNLCRRTGSPSYPKIEP